MSDFVSPRPEGALWQRSLRSRRNDVVQEAVMSDTSSSPATWPVLGLTDRRVLGVLVEKQKTTPDVYPMTLNGLVTGYNQKSNRDPILSLTDIEAEESLARLQKLGLVMRVDSGRVEKWRHTLYDVWEVT